MAATTELSLNTQDEVLAALSAGQIDTVAAGKRLAELQPKGNNGVISIKVKPKGVKYKDGKGVEREGKGNISVYGLQRMPVTLYAGQWMKLLADEIVKKILDTIEENRDVLDWKE